ncbi:MAG: hypothetical protein QF917_00170 [Candidatus Woesearchaeota archaeon]|nr:hypothetical protein [Candidatus Woesearchaeota archaeon]
MLFASLLISLTAVYADEVGCCINPGAGILACATEKLAQRDGECCPKPETSFPSYYDPETLGPSSYNNCIDNFFFPNQNCDSVSECEIGCCCSSLSGELKTQAQCSGTGLTFLSGETDCITACAVPECNDGLDNDNNGCADFPGDSGCQSQEDDMELGGTCFTTTGPNCDNINYVPELSDFEAIPAKGRKEINLEWENECASNIVSNEIYRCDGGNCNDFELIGSSTQSFFIDQDDELEFNQIYSYKVISYYSVQTAEPNAITHASLGSLECWNKFDDNNFCILESYYGQYQSYLIDNFAGFSSSNFNQNVGSNFGDNLNRAYFCNDENLLKAEGTVCQDDEACVVSNNIPKCIKKTTCNYESANPFGLFYNQQECETDKYCFYDRSLSVADSCFDCSPEMSCYDYKSEASCTRNNCNTGDCTWKPISDELGAGVCIDKNKDNCMWCDKAGTSGLKSANAANFVFEQCGVLKAQVLSNENFLCYYGGEQTLNCADITCLDYLPGECESSNILYDQFNNLIKLPKDKCSIGICQNFNEKCRKNADSDNKPDCETDECEHDIFAPNTTIIPTIDRGIYESLSIEIFDKTMGNGAFTRRTKNDYKTYLCKEPCNSQHPYSITTNSYNIILGNLNLFDTLTGDKLMVLDEGANTIRYYSEDPSKNIGKVKIVEVTANSNANGPLVFRMDVSDGNLIKGAYYTRSTRPTITVEFFEEAIATYASLSPKGSPSEIFPDFSDQLSKKVEFIFSDDIAVGDYVFELNAKDKNGVLMDETYEADITIDNENPGITAMTPTEGEIVQSSIVPISITFNKNTILDTITINNENITSEFMTDDSKTYVANMIMEDSNKEIIIMANDFAGNIITSSLNFVVNAEDVKISLVNPRYGVSSSYTFDIIIKTDNNAVCRYSFDDNLNFEFMDDFGFSGGTEHKITAFSEILAGDTEIYRFYVKCDDTIHNIKTNVFDLSVDVDAPKIITGYAFPDPIVEDPRITTLNVKTDKETVCEYSDNINELLDVNNIDQGNNTFREVNKKEITVDSDKDYTYYVKCMSKAELISDIYEIQFSSDLSLPLIVTSNTLPFSTDNTINLAVETNKKSQCKYSIDSQVEQGTIIGSPSYSHIKQLNLNDGKYTYYVKCKDLFKQEWSDPIEIELVMDSTEPDMIFAEDTGTLVQFPEHTCNTDRLRVKWLGSDEESDIQNYFYSIIKEPGDVILDWTTSFWYSDPAENDEWLWIDELTLDIGTKYLFGIKALNFAELESDVLKTDGITIDTSKCDPLPACGDGVINFAGEQCDRSSFGIINECTDYSNFIGGNLKCDTGCKLDTSKCVLQPFCGDGTIQSGEHCDGSLFGAIDACNDLDFSGGTITCQSNCFLDTSKCQPQSECGNGIIDPGEECDGTNLGPLTENCEDYDQIFTGESISCNSNCKIDTSSCFGTRGTCGDGSINIGEKCDTINFGEINDCTDYGEFAEGLLECNANCELNTELCVPIQSCGNGIIDQGELCDGTNLGSITDSCTDYSTFFNSGTLSCGNDCMLNTNNCEESPSCGNGRLDSGELCDGTNFGNITDLSCFSYNENFINGTLTCNSCDLSTSKCSANNTPITTCRDRGDCGLNEYCTDNSDCLSRYCFDNKCSEASCNDDKKNQGESDIDCGGNSCLKCQNNKKCNLDSDCLSDFCLFGTCENIDSCNDNELGGTESDIDCGGACPEKCKVGETCEVDDDCEENTKCTDSVCKLCGENDLNCNGIPDDLEGLPKDTDNDGIPDEWELEQGLDPNDASDAEMDFDTDGLNNIQEFTYSTNPNNADTDGDNASDKKEIDKGTDPLDPNSKPKGIFWTVVLIFVLVMLLGGGGYGVYYYLKFKPEKELKPSLLPGYMPTRPILRKPRKKPIKKIQEQVSKIKEKRKKEKREKRDKLVGVFEKKKQEAKKGQKPAKAKITPKEAGKEKKLISVKKEPGKAKTKPKEEKKGTKADKNVDIFAKLKLISEKGNTGPIDEKTFKKLKNITKGEGTEKKSNKKKSA